MGAPKLNKNAFKKSPARSKAGDSRANDKDRKAIKHFQDQINQFVQDEKGAKKAALILELLINKSKK